MYIVTQPTVLRRSLSLKLTTRCQTRVSLPEWRHSLNHVLLVHCPGPDLPMAFVTAAQALQTPRQKADRAPKATELENVLMWNDTVSQKLLSIPPETDVSKRQVFHFGNFSTTENTSMTQPGDHLVPVSVGLSYLQR